MQTARPHLKAARLSMGRTAFDQAQITGTTETKVYGVERGRITPDARLALIWAASVNMAPEQAFPELFTEAGQCARN